MIFPPEPRSKAAQLVIGSSPLTRLPAWALMAIPATIPLLFGAVHPIVQGGYVALICIGLGGWLLYAQPEEFFTAIRSRWITPFLLVLGFTVFQVIPLPFAWVELLSPARAERVAMVNLLAQGGQHYLALSEQGWDSLRHTSLLLALVIYFLAARTQLLTDKTFMQVLVLIIALVGSFEAVYGLFQFVQPRLGLLWLPLTGGRAAHGTIIYKNQYAALLNLCWPVTLAMAMVHLRGLTAPHQPSRLSRSSRSSQSARSSRSSRSSWRRAAPRRWLRRLGETGKEAPLLLFATGLMLLAILFSLSRGGILTMLFIFFLLNLFLPINTTLKRITLALISLFLLGYGLMLGMDTVINRFDTLDASGNTRFTLYFASLQMLYDHWATGIGLGSYTLLSPVYLKEFAANIHFDHAHNEYLQLALELGIPAATLLFGWLTWIMVTCGKRLLQWTRNHHQTAPPSVLIGSAAFCSLLGLLVHGLMEFSWRLPANILFAVTLAALLSYALADKTIATNLDP